MLAFILSAAFAQAGTGATIFENNCATCHAGTDPRVPTVASLRQRTPESIVDALTVGAMREHGAPLSNAEKRAVAEFLGRALQSSTANPNNCAAPPPLNLSSGPR